MYAWSEIEHVEFVEAINESVDRHRDSLPLDERPPKLPVLRAHTVKAHAERRLTKDEFEECNDLLNECEEYLTDADEDADDEGANVEA